jgi:hypothetical protein
VYIYPQGAAIARRMAEGCEATEMEKLRELEAIVKMCPRGPVFDFHQYLMRVKDDEAAFFFLYSGGPRLRFSVCVCVNVHICGCVCGVCVYVPVRIYICRRVHRRVTFIFFFSISPMLLPVGRCSKNKEKS